MIYYNNNNDESQDMRTVASYVLQYVGVAKTVSLLVHSENYMVDERSGAVNEQIIMY